MDGSTTVAADAGYETDFYAWTQSQARAIRAAGAAGLNAPVDWENVAEEIESLGRSDLRRIRSHIATIMEHLLKLEWSPARDPRNGWLETVRRARRDLRLVVDDSPSLRARLPELIADEEPDVRQRVAEALLDRAEIDRPTAMLLRTARYAPASVLDPDWFPPDTPRAG